MTVGIFLISIALSCLLFAFLAWFAWRRGEILGSRAYAGLALGECLLALAEILSMLSPDPAGALFWFKCRYTAMAAVAVLWLVFALEYSGRKGWLTKKFLAAVLVIPVAGQVILWTGRWHLLWTRREPSFRRVGAFWLADVRDRLPGPGHLLHSFYSLILFLAGIVLLLVVALGKRRLHRAQAVLVASAALIASVVSFVFSFNVFPRIEVNLMTPGLGITGLLVVLAVFRFGFLKTSPVEAGAGHGIPKIGTLRSPAVFMLVFILMTTGISSVGYLSYLRYKDHFLTQASRQLEAISKLKSDALVDWRNERLADAELLQGIPAFHRLAGKILENPADAGAREEFRAWMEQYEISGQYDRTFLLGTDGVERMSFLAPPESAPSHLQEVKDEVLRERRIRFLDFHRAMEDGPIHLSLLVPVRPERPAEESPGLLVLRIDPHQYLYPFISTWPGPSKSAETLLVRREGNEVVFLNALRFQPDSALNLRFPLMNERLPAAMAALGKEGVMEGTDYRGAEVIAALRAVPDSPWSLVARMDKAEVYAPLWERLRQTLLVLTALITASGAGLAAAWRRQRLGDFRRLEESAQALRAGERLLREIAANYPRSYISIIEKDMTVGFTSGQEFRKRGLNPEDFVGLTLEQVFGDKASFVREHYLRAFDGREAEFELFFDGQHQLYRAIPLADERGRIPRILAVVENITDRKRQESEILAARDELKRLLDVAERARRVLLSVVEDQKASEEEVRKLNVELERRVRDRTAQLESANKELEAFAYSASHDLRAPLRGIDGWSLALLEDYHHRLDDKARGFLERIRAETQRMGRLIDDLLHFSRETRGELNMQAVDMTALAETVVARLVGEHPAAEVRIVIRPGLKARGDARLLEIVLVNLLDNALKFSRSRTPALVEFGRSDRDGRGVFFIRDNGVGFDMTYADKLFKVFQRLHGASEFPGSGIGLATVRNIISRHGGRIWAEAEPGGGATFYFTLEESS